MNEQEADVQLDIETAGGESLVRYPPQWFEKLTDGTRLADMWEAARTYLRARVGKEHSRESDEVLHARKSLGDAVENFWASGERPAVWPWLAETVPQWTRAACAEKISKDGTRVMQYPVLPDVTALAFASGMKESGVKSPVDGLLQSEMKRIGIPVMRSIAARVHMPKIPSATTGADIHRWAQSTRIPQAEVFRAIDANLVLSRVSHGELSRRKYSVGGDFLDIPSEDTFAARLDECEMQLIEQASGVGDLVRNILTSRSRSIHMPQQLESIVAGLRWTVESRILPLEKAEPLLHRAYALMHVSMTLTDAPGFRDIASLLTGGSVITELDHPYFGGDWDYVDAAMLLGAAVLSPKESAIDLDAAKRRGMDVYSVFAGNHDPTESPLEAYTLFLVACMRMTPSQRETYGQLIESVQAKMKTLLPKMPVFGVDGTLAVSSLRKQDDRSFSLDDPSMSIRQQMMRNPGGMCLVACDYNDYEMERTGKIVRTYDTDTIGLVLVDYPTGKTYRVEADHVLHEIDPTSAEGTVTSIQKAVSASEALMRLVENAQTKLTAHVRRPEIQGTIEAMRKIGGESVGSVVDNTKLAAFIGHLTGHASGFPDGLAEGIDALAAFVRGESGIDPAAEGDTDTRALILKVFAATGEVPRDLWMEMQIQGYERMIGETAKSLLEGLKKKEAGRVEQYLGKNAGVKTMYDVVMELSEAVSESVQGGFLDTNEGRERILKFTQELSGLFSLNARYSLRFGSVWQTVSGMRHINRDAPEIWAQCNSSAESVLACLKYLQPTLLSVFGASYGAETSISMSEWIASLGAREKSGDTAHAEIHIPLHDGSVMLDGTASNIGYSVFVPKREIQQLPESSFLTYGAKIRYMVADWENWKRESIVSCLRGGSTLVGSMALEMKSYPLMMAADPDSPQHLYSMIHSDSDNDIRMNALEKLLRTEPRFVVTCSEPIFHQGESEKWLSNAISLAAQESKWWVVLYLSDLGRKAGYFSEDYRKESGALYESAATVLAMVPPAQYDSEKAYWAGLIPDETDSFVEKVRAEAQRPKIKIKRGQLFVQRFRNALVSLKEKGKALSHAALMDTLAMLRNMPTDPDPASERAGKIRRDLKSALKEGERIGTYMQHGSVEDSLIPMESINFEDSQDVLRNLLSDGGEFMSSELQVQQMRLLCAVLIRSFTEMVSHENRNESDTVLVGFLHQRQLVYMLQKLRTTARLIKADGVAQAVVTSAMTEISQYPERLLSRG